MKRIKKFTVSFVTAITLLAVFPVTAHAEWKADNTGWWYSEGKSYATSWRNINGQWYYFDSNGYMKTGWFNDNGNWYYFNEDGTMARETAINGYYMNSNGIASSNKIDLSSGTWSCH